MLIRTFVGGPIGTQTYLVGDEAAGQAMVVDAPGGIAQEVVDEAARLGLKIVVLVSTHGHWDHIADNAALHRLTGAPIAVHSRDARMLEQPSTAPFALPIVIPPSKPERLLREWDEILVGSLRFSVVHTPGHTPGSICLYEPSQRVLFSGDTLFASGYGRTDLPGGDEAALELSLGRLAALPPDVQVYPGHGPATTLGDEAWLQSYRPV